MFKQTAISSIDSYKIGHKFQYPKGTTKVYSNFTPRSSEYLHVPKQYKTNKIVWFGLQAFLMELNDVWKETFFEQSWESVSKELDMYIPFCGPNGVDKSHFELLWKLKYLPIEIKAIAEGTEVPIGVPVLTITNTLPEFYWLPNFLETWISSALWQASTSATISQVYRKIIDKYADLTGGSKEFVSWQGHDFSVRGMGGIQSAAMSGAGHLLSFTGTDNLPAIKLINDCYDGANTFIGGSVPATEHSVMCAGGKESEIETFRRLIKTYPSGVLSIVSDTWDFWNVITNMASELKEEILSRTPDELGLAKVVFRPDSGNPVRIICGDYIPDYSDKCDTLEGAARRYARLLVDEDERHAGHGELGSESISELMSYGGKTYRVSISVQWNRYDKQFYFVDGYEVETVEEVQLTPAQKGAVECLAEIFGTTTNDAGYKTLNQRVGLIYGDSITPERAEEILYRLKQKGYASDNIVFGIGSYTFQYNTRDTLGFAMKATYVEIDGVGQPIFKDPKTDSGMKKSAKGLLKVVSENGNIILKDNVSVEEESDGLLQRVYLNGSLYRTVSFEQIRNNLNAQASD